MRSRIISLTVFSAISISSLILLTVGSKYQIDALQVETFEPIWISTDCAYKKFNIQTKVKPWIIDIYGTTLTNVCQNVSLEYYTRYENKDCPDKKELLTILNMEFPLNTSFNCSVNAACTIFRPFFVPSASDKTEMWILEVFMYFLIVLTICTLALVIFSYIVIYKHHKYSTIA